MLYYYCHYYYYEKENYVLFFKRYNMSYVLRDLIIKK
jgi:hypothetical protein